MKTFLAADIDARFGKQIHEFDALIATHSDQLTGIGDSFRKNLAKEKERPFLTIAFVGAYSAGKSTIVSGLTGRRDIKISADISTDKATPYDWHNIKVIDTPGLFTERTDHDAITLEAIDRADLLVFCLTHSLFNDITVENFKKLAFTQGFRHKMMLLVNKMSAEASGDDESRKARYRESLAMALKPFSLDEFPICFIDAKDYCDGVDQKDQELIDLSGFSSFVAELNAFVQKRGVLARLDTPIRLLLSSLDEVAVALTRVSSEDSAYLELLSRLMRKVDQGRRNLRIQATTIQNELVGSIWKMGDDLARGIGTLKPDEVQRQADQMNGRIEKETAKASAALEKAVDDLLATLKKDVEEVLESPLANTFHARLKAGRVSGADGSPQGKSRLGEQFEGLKKLQSTVCGPLAKAAEGAKAASGGFLTASGAAGSELHGALKGLAQFFGVKLKPWQAVGWAKNLGNVAKAVGPILGVLAIAVDFADEKRATENEQKLADARRDITSQFRSIAKDIEIQFQAQVGQVEDQVYGPLTGQIQTLQESEMTGIGAANEGVKAVNATKGELKSLLQKIRDEVHNQVN